MMNDSYLCKAFACCLLLGTVACGQIKMNTRTRGSTFVSKIDSLKTVLPTVGEKRFDFKLLSPETEFNWSRSSNLLRIDAPFFDQYLEVSVLFTQYLRYQSLYYYCFLKCSSSNIPLVIAQWATRDESYMFLVLFDSTGVIKTIDTLAAITKSPIDLYRVTSEVTRQCRVKMSSVYIYTNDDERRVYTDSLSMEYDLGDSGITGRRIIDSMRVVTPYKQKALHQKLQ